MIEIERRPTNRVAFAVPDSPPLPERLTQLAVPKLGPSVAKREEHERRVADSVAEMVEVEDDALLLELDDKYVGKCFRDEQFRESRLVEKIEWNPEAARFQAVTVKVHPDGTRMQRPCRAPYGLSADERPEFDRMIDLFERTPAPRKRNAHGRSPLKEGPRRRARSDEARV